MFCVFYFYLFGNLFSSNQNINIYSVHDLLDSILCLNYRMFLAKQVEVNHPSSDPIQLVSV